MAFGDIIRTVDINVIDARGLVFDGRYIWTTSIDDNRTYMLNRDGKTVKSVSADDCFLSFITDRYRFVGVNTSLALVTRDKNATLVRMVNAEERCIAYNQYDYYTVFIPNALRHVDRDGRVKTSTSITQLYYDDIVFDGKNSYAVRGSTLDQLDIHGNIIKTVSLEGNCYGMILDGKNLLLLLSVLQQIATVRIN